MPPLPSPPSPLVLKTALRSRTSIIPILQRRKLRLIIGKPFDQNQEAARHSHVAGSGHWVFLGDLGLIRLHLPSRPVRELIETGFWTGHPCPALPQPSLTWGAGQT